MAGTGDPKRVLPPPPVPALEIRPSPPEAAVRRLQETLRLPRVLCAILASRGLESPEAAKSFLRPLLTTLHPPSQLADLSVAVARLREAVRRGETVFVHGDYDVDGMAGTALLTRWLRRLGATVVPFIPNRLQDGYDLGPRGLEEARKSGSSLLLTVDCGILAHEAVDAAVSSGMDVIVTDHHSPAKDLPPARAVLNPNRSDCSYPNKGLCGAGVAFKLCQGLAEAEGIADDELYPLLDLVALATVADLVPLTGENRTLVRFGLRALERTENPGLRALLAVSSLDRGGVTSGTVGFVLAPRLNAIGRLGDPALALRLLLTSDSREAAALAREADALNRTRQTADRDTLQEALDQLAAGFDPLSDFGIVLAADHWHPGVVGIVASRVVERLHRPTVLVAMHGDAGKGSARSIPGFHLLDAIRVAGKHLERFGGHRQAAGMEVRREKLPAFREAFNAEAERRLKGQELRPYLTVDLEVRLEEMTEELYGFMKYLGPHGMGNPGPVFLGRDVELRTAPRIVGGSHLKLRLGQGRTEMEGIGFNLGDRMESEALASGPLDVVFQLHENEFRGSRTLQARVKEIRVAGGRLP